MAIPKVVVGRKPLKAIYFLAAFSLSGDKFSRNSCERKQVTLQINALTEGSKNLTKNLSENVRGSETNYLFPGKPAGVSHNRIIRFDHKGCRREKLGRMSCLFSLQFSTKWLTESILPVGRD